MRFHPQALIDYKQLRANRAHGRTSGGSTTICLSVYAKGRLVADNYDSPFRVRDLRWAAVAGLTRIDSPAE